MHVLDVELESWAVWRLGDPKVKVLMFAGFEKKDVVAVVELSDLIKLVQVFLGVELGLFSGVGHQLGQILDEMSVSVGDASRRNYENTLSVDMLCLFGLLLGAVGLEGFVDGTHG